MPPKNKKFLAQKQKEDLQKRIIIISTIAVLAIVFGLVIFGVLDRFVFTPRQTVISLEGETVKADEFEQQIRWQRRSRIIEIDQILITYQQLGASPEIFAYFEGQLNLIISQLQQPLLIGEEILQALTQELIIQVEAKKMGIEVTEAQVDRGLQEAFGFFIDGTPTPEATLALPEPTQDEDGEGTSSTDTEGTGDPTATPLLVPTEYTEELFNNNYQEFVDSLKSDGIKEQTVRDIIMMTLIRQEVRDVVTSDVERSQEQVSIQHILVDAEETALEVLEKLEDGETFEDLASEYSQDTSNAQDGGDLGWFGRGRMVDAFEEAAFSLEVGEISGAVETDFGWHILKSNGKEDRLLDLSAYEQLKNQAFIEWLTEKELEYQPEIHENWERFVPSEPSIPPNYLAFIESIRQGGGQLPLPSPTP
jgi:parvulin-like peptidyl-prolyl isomerase